MVRESIKLSVFSFIYFLPFVGKYSNIQYQQYLLYILQKYSNNCDLCSTDTNTRHDMDITLTLQHKSFKKFIVCDTIYTLNLILITFFTKVFVPKSFHHLCIFTINKPAYPKENKTFLVFKKSLPLMCTFMSVFLECPRSVQTKKVEKR